MNSEISKNIVGSLLFLTLLLFYAGSFSETEQGNVFIMPGHHTADGFQNDPFVESASNKGILFYLRRVWGSLFTPDVPSGHVLSESEAMHSYESVEGDAITWLGHATFLIRNSGKTILTDPFLTDFASPVSWAGPRRFVEPGIPIDNLPNIDILLVSHNHYDHLDDETVRRLQNKDRMTVIVPLGLKGFFMERGYDQVVELDWHEEFTINNLTITAVPAVHDSARSFDDKNKTLWASWAIAGVDNRMLFVGDTGYSDAVFKKIGADFAGFDFAILPIGAYEPRKLMWMSHITPEEAVKIGIEVRANKIVASHWGTVSSLSDEPLWEPPKRFLASGIDSGYNEESIWLMKVGETRGLRVSFGNVMIEQILKLGGETGARAGSRLKHAG